MYLFILLLVTVLVACAPRQWEQFEMSNGLCDCCECGFVSCAECTKQISKCCNGNFSFDRYTFS